MKRLALGTALLAFGISTACAQNTKVGDIEIDHAWAPSTARATNSAAYMRLIGEHET
jgi:copper(I)-binding protein